ncbi:helix-turn-helix domain-containing protein [Candidatus Microgenomates bacterium]|nr:helix-turn-helix domain-containing protein [Candidatus Microgenomates bacterium]
MTTVGQILSLARNHKKLTLEQVEKTTKIRLKFLVAIEKDEFSKLPPGTFTKGFIKNYASFLGLPVEETLAFYRRQVNEDKSPSLPTKPVQKQSITFSFTAIGVGILVVLFFVYLAYSYIKFAGAPSLLVNYPPTNAVVSKDQIDVTGKTDPDTIVTINGQKIPIGETGTFSAQITLTPGLNTITVVASNKFNKQSTISRNLRLEKN